MLQIKKKITYFQMWEKIKIKKKFMCKEDRNYCGLGRCQELVVFCFAFCHCDKHHIQNQLGEGGLIQAYSL